MNKWFQVGSAMAGLGVVIGAFGAHGLKLAPDMLEIYKTATLYHLVHALAIFGLGMAGPRTRLDVAAWLLLWGIILFSGSLYALAITGIRMLGAITPFGGLAFIAGWAVLAFSRSTNPAEV